MWLFKCLPVFLTVADVACARPLLRRHEPNARQLFESTSGVFFENVIVRSNGHLLMTTFNEGRVYSFDPRASNSTPQVVAHIPGVNGSLGISEIYPDVFAVNSGDFIGSELSLVEGTAKVVTLDFTKEHDQGKEPVIKTVARVPNTTMLNGMASLPYSPHVVLCADSKLGRIFRINTLTGSTKVIYQHPLLARNAKFQLGMNGLRVLEDHLYFSSTASRLFGRFAIDAQGNIIGDMERLAWLPESWATGYDDFALSKDGVAYVATQTNKFIRISADNKQVILLDEHTKLAPKSPTSAALSKDEKFLYLITGGSGLTDPVKGGQIIEVRL
ncbi:hypothetical protein FOBRF1_007472 [Fusarium oxysporum]